MLIRIRKGVYGYRGNGPYIVPIRAGECCEVSAAKAADLAARGIAEIVSEDGIAEAVPVGAAETAVPAETAAEAVPDGANPDEKADGETAVDYAGMKLSELREFADERGIPINGLRTKAELIAAIRTAEGPDLSVVEDIIG